MDKSLIQRHTGPLAAETKDHQHSGRVPCKSRHGGGTSSSLSECPSLGGLGREHPGEAVEKRVLSFHEGEDGNWENCYGPQARGPSEELNLERPHNPALPLWSTYPESAPSNVRCPALILPQCSENQGMETHPMSSDKR